MSTGRACRRLSLLLFLRYLLASCDSSRGGYANTAPLHVLESSPSNECHHHVTQVSQADLLVGRIHVHFECSQCAPHVIAHVHHVQIKH